MKGKQRAGLVAVYDINSVIRPQKSTLTRPNIVLGYDINSAIYTMLIKCVTSGSCSGMSTRLRFQQCLSGFPTLSGNEQQHVKGHAVIVESVVFWPNCYRRIFDGYDVSVVTGTVGAVVWTDEILSFPKQAP